MLIKLSIASILKDQFIKKYDWEKWRFLRHWFSAHESNFTIWLCVDMSQSCLCYSEKIISKAIISPSCLPLVGSDVALGHRVRNTWQHCGIFERSDRAVVPALARRKILFQGDVSNDRSRIGAIRKWRGWPVAHWSNSRIWIKNQLRLGRRDWQNMSNNVTDFGTLQTYCITRWWPITSIWVKSKLISNLYGADKVKFRVWSTWNDVHVFIILLMDSPRFLPLLNICFTASQMPTLSFNRELSKHKSLLHFDTYDKTEWISPVFLALFHFYKICQTQVQIIH